MAARYRACASRTAATTEVDSTKTICPRSNHRFNGGRGATFELSLRPRVLAEYIGQTGVKDNLDVAIQAARKRGEPLDDILSYGPPGLGKTTLASVIANEMNARFRATAGPLIQLKGDLTAILTNLEFGDVLFIDEIHRLQPNIEEILYPAMEDYKLDIIIGQGPSARTTARFTALHPHRCDHSRRFDYGPTALAFRNGPPAGFLYSP